MIYRQHKCSESRQHYSITNARHGPILLFFHVRKQLINRVITFIHRYIVKRRMKMTRDSPNNWHQSGHRQTEPRSRNGPYRLSCENAWIQRNRFSRLSLFNFEITLNDSGEIFCRKMQNLHNRIFLLRCTSFWTKSSLVQVITCRLLAGLTYVIREVLSFKWGLE